MRRSIFAILLLTPGQAWCWGDDGHRAVARIAAAHLTETARQAVVRLLSADAAFTGADGTGSVADAMARAAIWPDHMPGGKGATAPWHYVDIGLFEGPSRMDDRCPGGNCIVAKMKQYLVNLKNHAADGDWPESRELAFLIHFAGDIHQPLHCSTDADAGGNCVTVTGYESSRNLHSAWDTALVRELMSQDGPEMIAGMETRFRGRLRAWQAYGSIEEIAGESFHLARKKVYGKARPRLPVIDYYVEVHPSQCAVEAPPDLLAVKVDGPRSYGAAARNLVREQLYKGGVRLAVMLNTIYGE